MGIMLESQNAYQTASYPLPTRWAPTYLVAAVFAQSPLEKLKLRKLLCVLLLQLLLCRRKAPFSGLDFGERLAQFGLEPDVLSLSPGDHGRTVLLSVLKRVVKLSHARRLLLPQPVRPLGLLSPLKLLPLQLEARELGLRDLLCKPHYLSRVRLCHVGRPSAPTTHGACAHGRLGVASATALWPDEPQRDGPRARKQRLEDHIRPHARGRARSVAHDGHSLVKAQRTDGTRPNVPGRLLPGHRLPVPHQIRRQDRGAGASICQEAGQGQLDSADLEGGGMSWWWWRWSW